MRVTIVMSEGEFSSSLSTNVFYSKDEAITVIDRIARGTILHYTSNPASHMMRIILHSAAAELNQINFIKAIRNASGLGLIHAKRIAERLIVNRSVDRYEEEILIPRDRYNYIVEELSQFCLVS